MSVIEKLRREPSQADLTLEQTRMENNPVLRTAVIRELPANITQRSVEAIAEEFGDVERCWRGGKYWMIRYRVVSSVQLLKEGKPDLIISQSVYKTSVEIQPIPKSWTNEFALWKFKQLCPAIHSACHKMKNGAKTGVIILHMEDKDAEELCQQINDNTISLKVTREPLHAKKVQFSATGFLERTATAEERRQILRIRMQEDGVSWVITEPYANDGATISSSHSLAYFGEQLLIGTTFGRLLHCDVLNPQIT
ncbi:unnamed protein product [Caenorhabditis angaria]|uniref:Uncharacterized protein n=1 Tax=Caenorhabditis angaria TaxID=860376 RepID=A0A9P1MS25_9PELO|nr:unnamed protein product [Caenorhabditis angaria]